MKTRISSLAVAFIILIGVFQFAQAQATTSGTVNANANVRSGPGTDYRIVGNLAAGSAVTITSCNADCSWYEVSPGVWIAAFLVTTDSAAPQPTATPTTQPATTAAPITIVSWNVESGGALQNVVAERMGSFQDVDIWGLSEVNAIDAEAFEFGAEEGESANYESYLGTTGRADRLLLIWDEDRFDLLDSGQMTDIGQGARSPLWVQLKESATGLEFTVMVNHLHRSNEGTRHRQAQMLNAWAAGQNAPVIAIGDYNFDWNLPNGDADHDLGYDNMTKDGVWKWVRPAELVTTQCSGWPCSYNSVLDFVFVAGPAREWNISSEIIVEEDDFPDDFTTPDHRPVKAVILPTGQVSVPSADQSLLPTPTATSAPACPQTDSTGNLRAGPGTGYAIVGSVQQGQCITITGRTEVGDWFQVGPGVWIAAFLVANPGPMAEIPVVAAPPTSVPPTSVPPTSTTVPPTVVPTQVVPTPVPPTATPQPQCDPNYAGACIPIVGYDLNCGDIPDKRFQSIGSDPHNFDGDADGLACES